MNQRQWLYTDEAAIALDLKSAEVLRKLYRAGTFKVGFHVRDVSPTGSGRPTLQFHIKRCEEVLALPPEKRRRY